MILTCISFGYLDEHDHLRCWAQNLPITIWWLGVQWYDQKRLVCVTVDTERQESFENDNEIPETSGDAVETFDYNFTDVEAGIENNPEEVRDLEENLIPLDIEEEIQDHAETDCDATVEVEGKIKHKLKTGKACLAVAKISSIRDIKRKNFLTVAASLKMFV